MLTEKERKQFKKQAALLKREGYSQIVFTAVDTYQRLTSTCGSSVDRRQDAQDHLYIAEAVRDGRKGCVYFTQLPQIPEMIPRLKEAIKASGAEKSAPDEENSPVRLMTGEPAMIWETHEAVTEDLLATVKAADQVPGQSLLTRLAYVQNEVDIYVCGGDGTEYGDTTGYHCLEVEHKMRRGKEAAVARMNCYCKAIRELALRDLIRIEARLAAQELGGKPVASGRYPVILKNTVMASMLEAFLPAFYGDWILSQRSYLAGKLGQRVASPCVNIREVPALAHGRSTRRIDDEGHPVREKDLILEGVFRTALLNQKLARMLQWENTGNGFRSGPFNDDGIGVTNILLKGQEPCPARKLFETFGSGLYVTGVEGLMAGTDIRTGRFSLLVKGRRIENGQKSGAFCQVTIAGNFFDMLKDIRGIANDYASTGPDSECVFAPSVWVGELTVSGE